MSIWKQGVWRQGVWMGGVWQGEGTRVAVVVVPDGVLVRAVLAAESIGQNTAASLVRPIKAREAVDKVWSSALAKRTKSSAVIAYMTEC